MAATDEVTPSCIDLFSNVWWDLERDLEVGSSFGLEADEKSEFWQLLRLELYVALDQCRSEGSSILLVKPQRKLLRKTILEVLRCLDAAGTSRPPREDIERAQNALFDAIDALQGFVTCSTVEMPLRRVAS